MARKPIDGDIAEKRRRARIRRDRVKARAPARPVDLIIRVDPEPLLPKSGDSGQYEPLLVPDIALQNHEGRYPRRQVIEFLERALAVHCLLAYHGLLAILGTPTAARDALAKVAHVDPSRLLTLGRRHLSVLTGLDSEEELRGWSELKYKHLRRLGFDLPEDLRSERVAAEAVPILLIGGAINRAKAILNEMENVQRAEKRSRKRSFPGDGYRIDAVHHDKIQKTFLRFQSDLSVTELWELAVFSDFNPVALWPQHIKYYAELFDIARFLGKVDLGSEAKIGRFYLELLDRIVRGAYGPTGDDRDVLVAATRSKLFAHFDGEMLLDAIRRAVGSGGSLVVCRGDRRLMIGPAIDVADRDDPFISRLMRAVRDHFPTEK